MLNIYWFRKDLRITDNKGLFEFVKNVSGNDKFSFLYIKNRNTYKYFGEMRIGFLIECLADLEEELDSFGFKLQIIEGKSKGVFKKLIDEHSGISVYCNEQAEPYCISRDRTVKESVEKSGGTFNSYTDTTIFKLGEIKNGEGQQYKVFTPFKNESLKILTSGHYKKTENNLSSLNKSNEVTLKESNLYNLEKEYRISERSETIRGGRKEGLISLKYFYENGLVNYKEKRDFPAAKGTSFLSAHLHFGTVSIREAFRTAFSKIKKAKNESEQNSVQTWINELLWREFYYNITYHNPQITFQSFKKEYDNLKWNYDESLFKKWCEGKTGFPIVDAGMRQLNSEGWMHNRVRMIAAMFLTKDLFIDWRYGEKYFADKLIDLDFSSNNGGWQWSASTGVDAQPYFRIFNPYLQSKKFDAEGVYIKKYLPELRSLPAEFVHEPNKMSMMEQGMYNVIIGKDYPEPFVHHFTAKNKAIEAFKNVMNQSDKFDD
ncbi:MAG: deoxyribodipyrimidine photo-lyase [Ignavibacteria bacterium]|nr:deoxyribodipyrimidine photo-lyase [Ignavibacteria bacterium]